MGYRLPAIPWLLYPLYGCAINLCYLAFVQCRFSTTLLGCCDLIRPIPSVFDITFNPFVQHSLALHVSHLTCLYVYHK
ncbi:hypothetical protein AG1IA_02047 [Rhizoctonia solani AG-1 IA]|uniref:Uncharacterized protein n=1 Tax=Thanatephorus cucumeris (strain AG1-IA) TaxID=983506 RepID=L8X0S3_THACA|nr:hypothetical protein AG1IA_02047 [Rhizoctonia solani AG-1 IA]